MNEKILVHKDIGEIKIVKTSRAKNISISVRPFSGVRVSIPKYISYASAIRFIEKKEKWIIKNVAKMSAVEKRRIVFSEDTEFALRSHVLELRSHNEHEVKTRIKDGKISILYPGGKNVESEEIQEKIRETIIKAIRKEAKAYLPYRVKYFAEKYNFKIKDIKLKNAKTRWGSCSSTNNINLNIHLIRLPDHLLDYVILHELAHTVHKNHGKKFWDLVNELTDGKAIGYRAEMRKFQTQIF